METEKDIPVEGKRKSLCGRIAPRFVNALAPMIRQVDEMAHSDFFFMSQVDTRRFGSYLIPGGSGGVVLAVVDSYRVLAVLDPDGDATEPLKVHFPDAMLDAIQPRMISLANQDGVGFQVEAEPKPHSIFISDICTIVALDRDGDKKYGGCIGSWMNNDLGNYIDLASYRAEPADIEFIKRAVHASLENRGGCSALQLNPRLLTPMCEAADRLGAMLDFSFAGDGGAVAIRSLGDVQMFGLIMPASYQPFDHESDITRTILEGSAPCE